MTLEFGTDTVFELWKGDDLSASFILTDYNSTVIDITGYSFTFSTAAIRAATADMTITGSIVTAGSGIFKFVFAPGDTSSLTYKDGKLLLGYIRITDAAGKLSTIEGTVTFKTR